VIPADPVSLGVPAAARGGRALCVRTRVRHATTDTDGSHVQRRRSPNFLLVAAPGFARHDGAVRLCGSALGNARAFTDDQRSTDAVSEDIRISSRRWTHRAIEVERISRRSALREQKFESAYLEWAKELRVRAYIEMRDPPH
jgi:hypothetical protein